MSGLPPAIRVSARASSSKTWVLFSGTAPGRSPVTAPEAADRISLISLSIGKSARRSPARSEKSGRGALAVSGARNCSWMISQKPWYAKARSRSTERPCRTRICRAFASFSSSSRSRVLPIPGSPPTTTNWDSPARAAFRRRCSSPNSFVRPTKGASTGRGVVRVNPVSGRSRSLSWSRER